MQEKNFIKSALQVIQIEGNAILALQDQLQDTFNQLCEAILNTEGKLVLMGIGKSGHIAQKISATLSSTGTPSFFIHPTEAAHGDLGMIEKKDSVLIFSNSGETKEILEVLPALKRCAGHIFTVTNNLSSTLAKAGEINIMVKANKEACSLDLAPTSSTTLSLVFGDALAIALLDHRGFTPEDFAKSHPAGQLGKKLTTLVRDLAIMNDHAPVVLESASLKEALIEVTHKKLGLTLVSNGQKVIGIFTDGDLRRCLSQDKDLVKTSIGSVMTKEFKTISHDSLAIDAAEIMERNKIFTLVVTGEEENVSGILTMHQLLESGII
ncbi:KpsF/GutQ family sugar-phosphate isomerase [Gammaproteobacteria bacterium]|nr:KpsF/GutQ family sugar-phosphate isomerase [Gammaproteobacteria bacterium]MDA9371205.1 KpsF/GutQ family sugar-phosphate isomerase [Gammaproteobacteria bacterium]MDB9700904.1 KpsF/GutQ family sugar-phosphate isomerase [Gammaproteobacteria bacterium]MDC0014881.1 KpsF/GutQ family sugar-phosphate isomerase [Gammaproteobacteria bacterium]MDC1300900.1 KpsF/GutQ family sugar-phosphate isomerase [Gammaproteobacteria bacterium]